MCSGERYYSEKYHYRTRDIFDGKYKMLILPSDNVIIERRKFDRRFIGNSSDRGGGENGPFSRDNCIIEKVYALNCSA